MSEKSENEIIQVGEIDPNKKTSPILNKDAEEESQTKVNTPCWFNGRQYSTGAKVCSGGRVLTCSWTGSWSAGGRC